MWQRMSQCTIPENIASGGLFVTIASVDGNVAFVGKSNADPNFDNKNAGLGQ